MSPRIAYVGRDFRPDSLDVIAQAEAICAAYAQQGFDLTLRQLYYQFVSRDLIPNTDRSYKRLGSIVNDARLAGLLDWNYIVDRTRNVRSLSHWNDPPEIVRAVSNQFRHDKWADQPCRPEVWIEKDALVGVIEGVCQANDVAYFSCRGYTSQSEVWGAAQRLGQYMVKDQQPVILHLGDHDPSGIDMSRDIEDRLRLFLDGDGFDPDDLEVRRLALNMDQVRQYDPPPNPAKLTDARAKGYIARHGASSWELDALEPTVLAALIQDAIHDVRAADLWTGAVAREEREREVLVAAAERWDEVAEFLS